MVFSFPPVQEIDMTEQNVSAGTTLDGARRGSKKVCQYGKDKRPGKNRCLKHPRKRRRR